MPYDKHGNFYKTMVQHGPARHAAALVPSLRSGPLVPGLRDGKRSEPPRTTAEPLVVEEIGRLEAGALFAQRGEQLWRSGTYASRSAAYHAALAEAPAVAEAWSRGLAATLRIEIHRSKEVR